MTARSTAALAACATVVATLLALRLLTTDDSRGGGVLKNPAAFDVARLSRLEEQVARLEQRLDMATQTQKAAELRGGGAASSSPRHGSGTGSAPGSETVADVGSNESPAPTRPRAPRPWREVPDLHPRDPRSRVLAVLGPPDVDRQAAHRGRNPTKKLLEYHKLGARIQLDPQDGIESASFFGDATIDAFEPSGEFDGDLSRYWFAPATWSYHAVDVGMTASAVVEKLGKAQIKCTERGFSLDYVDRDLTVGLGAAPDFLVVSFTIHALRP